MDYHFEINFIDTTFNFVGSIGNLQASQLFVFIANKDTGEEYTFREDSNNYLNSGLDLYEYIFSKINKQIKASKIQLLCGFNWCSYGHYLNINPNIKKPIPIDLSKFENIGVKQFHIMYHSITSSNLFRPKNSHYYINYQNLPKGLEILKINTYNDFTKINISNLPQSLQELNISNCCVASVDDLPITIKTINFENVIIDNTINEYIELPIYIENCNIKYLYFYGNSNLIKKSTYNNQVINFEKECIKNKQIISL